MDFGFGLGGGLGGDEEKAARQGRGAPRALRLKGQNSGLRHSPLRFWKGARHLSLLKNRRRAGPTRRRVILGVWFSPYPGIS